MFKDKVSLLLKEGLNKRPDLFLIDFSVGLDHQIKIVLDGDQGVDLSDCIEISRAIEHNLDREVQDFSIEVTSAGATAPLEQPRQFPKNIGRTLKVDTHQETYEGILTSVREEGIVLNWKQREAKPVGKGKHTVEKEALISFNQIKTAKVILKI